MSKNTYNIMILSVVALGAYFFYVNYKKYIEKKSLEIDTTTNTAIRNAYANVIAGENNDNTPN